MSIAKVLGIETEYGIIATGVESSPITSSSLLINSYVSRFDSNIGWDFDAERPGSDARGFSLDDVFPQDIEMLAKLGDVGPVQSPTYTYVTLYHLADGRTVYHFDLYRLSSYEQFVQAGFDEYLHDENGICFIEWPEKIQSLIPEKCTIINIEILPNGFRKLIYK